MKNNSNGMSTGAAILMTVGIMLLIGLIISAGEPECSMSGCDNDAKDDSSYCYLHDMSYRAYGNPDYNEVYQNSQNNRSNSSTGSSSSTSSTSKSTSGSGGSSSYSSGSTRSHSTYDSYDDGYDDVYFDDDYDWDRYYSDPDYADGVDDAMDELDW